MNKRIAFAIIAIITVFIVAAGPDLSVLTISVQSLRACKTHGEKCNDASEWALTTL